MLNQPIYGPTGNFQCQDPADLEISISCGNLDMIISKTHLKVFSFYVDILNDFAIGRRYLKIKMLKKSGINNHIVI